jgi:hypothetical protein
MLHIACSREGNIVSHDAACAKGINTALSNDEGKKVKKGFGTMNHMQK